jgi:hypothetical protein
MKNQEIISFLLGKSVYFNGWKYDNGATHKGTVSNVSDYTNKYGHKIFEITINENGNDVRKFEIFISDFYNYVLKGKMYKTNRWMNNGQDWSIDVTPEELKKYSDVVLNFEKEVEKKRLEEVEKKRLEELERIRLMNEAEAAKPKKGDKVIVNISRGKNKCKDAEGVIFWKGLCNFTGDDSYGVNLNDGRKLFTKIKNLTK